MFRKEALADASQIRREIFLKVVMDQVFFQAPYLNFYLFAMCVLEGNSPLQAVDRCKTNFHDAWAYAIVFWSPVQTINFVWVPAHLNGVFANTLCCFWVAFLSVLYHQRDYGGVGRHAPHTEPVIDVADDPVGSYELAVEVWCALTKAVINVSRTSSAGLATMMQDIAVIVGMTEASSQVDGPESTMTYKVIQRSQPSELSVLEELAHEIERQKVELNQQQWELELTRRTVSAQRVRIQQLHEALDKAGTVIDRTAIDRDVSSMPIEHVEPL